MSPLTSNSYAFSLDSTEAWAHYLKYRPPYPESLWKQWLDYHGADNALDAVLEVGAGCGIGTAGLLAASAKHRSPGNKPVVRRVYLSDPGTANIAAAEDMLRPQAYPGVELVFHQGPVEAGIPGLEPGTVDLVMACTCLHYTEIDKAMARVAEALRPGGTFAAVTYQVTPHIRGNERLAEAFRRFGDWNADRSKEDNPLYHDETWQRPLRQASVGLDFVRFDPALFENVERYYYNLKDVTWPLQAQWQRRAGRPVVGVDAAREKLEWVENWKDWEKKNCTVDWLRDMRRSLNGGYDRKAFESDAWKEVQQVAEESGGTFHVTWPVHVVLARRKAS
ncbi:hypothetical protein KVR01_001167 [Diaporthe batatas]|uniref:uncharacterized protein n=1 Tax=Diaporthe batatas TaxID=748121 RepID=UPI001D051BC2|nr:uncharacterized protein KVR01_001167 [Diaporthe batatas]KAG8168418.1 hypothetical protein KVR01_001167 [Diaporthe batatas]